MMEQRAVTIESMPVHEGSSGVWGRLVSVRRDGSDGHEHALSGEWVTIGKHNADIAYDTDDFIAPLHARLVKHPAGVEIVPMDRLNGVFVRVDAPVHLADGDTFLVGREVFVFELCDPVASMTPLSRHGISLFGSPMRRSWGQLRQLLSNGDWGDIRVLNSEEVVIGREEGDIVFRDDGFLSRMHVVIRLTDGNVELQDLASSNGTFIRLRTAQQFPFGVSFRIGDQLFRLDAG